MKRLSMVLFIVTIIAAAAMAQPNQNFTLKNATGVTIDQLFISPSEVNDWEEDVLGVDVLENEQDCEVHFSPAEERCDWDIKIVDTEGTAIIWTNIDLCKAAVITLHFDNGTPTASIEAADENGGDESAEDAGGDQGNDNGE